MYCTYFQLGCHVSGKSATARFLGIHSLLPVDSDSTDVFEASLLACLFFAMLLASSFELVLYLAIVGSLSIRGLFFTLRLLSSK